MRKLHPKFRWHLSAQEKQKIRKLTLAGVRQSEIARKLGITAPSVSKAQRAMALPTRVPVPEAKILKLFRRGWGGYRIARHLGVAVSAIYKVANKHHFRRKDGVGYPEPHGDVAGFIEALKRREGYIKHLAKKFGVGAVASRRIAHEVLATVRFRPGLSRPVLSSDFPQRHFDLKIGDPNKSVLLVSEIVRRCCGGKLPAPEAVTPFVAACLQLFVPPDTQPEIANNFALRLVEAVDCLRRTQNAPWTN